MYFFYRVEKPVRAYILVDKRDAVFSSSCRDEILDVILIKMLILQKCGIEDI